jgi:hypothetical protein
MQKLNVTTFTASKVALDIIDAMVEVKRTGIAQYLTNRKGHSWLRVALMVDDHGRRYFQFLDKGNRECGHIIRRCALTHWNLYVRRQFKRLESSLIIRPEVSDERDYQVTESRHIIAARNTASPITQRNAASQHNVNATGISA